MGKQSKQQTANARKTEKTGPSFNEADQREINERESSKMKNKKNSSKS